MRLWAALLFAVVIAVPAAARADGELVTKAKAEMAQLNYDAAIALLEQAEASGQNQPDDMAAIFRATAESHAAMGRGDAAETAFRRLLALDPSIDLPAGSSPKLTGPFNAARDFLAGRRLAVECRRGADGAASLVVKSDPVDLVAGARLLTADGGAIGEDAKGQGRVALAVPGGTSPAACAALDRHGNALARADLADAPAQDVSEAGAAPAGGTVVSAGPAERGDRPLYARWWLYAGLGAAAGGVALYYGLKMKSAEDDLAELHRRTIEEPDHDITYADALAVQDRGEGYARNANIALVATGVFAAVAGGLLVHQLMTDRDQDESPVEAAVLPGGAAVNLTLGF
jgi:tetratricopeptide (TPR) repeat protein